MTLFRQRDEDGILEMMLAVLRDGSGVEIGYCRLSGKAMSSYPMGSGGYYGVSQVFSVLYISTPALFHTLGCYWDCMYGVL